MTWETNIISDNRIISLSDIHGDIHSLIVALRDCGKVIKKKKTFEIDPSKIDHSVEILLEYDLNLDLGKDVPFYKDDLNYEWCGDNTFVVICGDFLDGFRNNFGNYRIPFIESRCDKCMDLEYDQVEIKIFRFINALNQEAKLSGGRIFKVLGNHEFINLNDNSINNYIPDWTKSLRNYYKNMTRDEYFKLNNEGSDLIFKDGAGLLLKINNNIFVHGRLDHSKSFDNYEKMNEILNIPNHLEEQNGGAPLLKQRLIRELNSSCSLTTWGRKYNRNFNNYENEKDLSHNQTEKCKQIRDYLGKFISGIKNNQYNVKDMRVIVGHCPQYLNSNEYYQSTVNSTFTTIQKNGQYEKLSLPIRTSKADRKNNFIFGIGMECNKEDLDNPKDHPNYTDNDNRAYVDYDQRYIYKVDVGSSRGFDQRLDRHIFTREHEKGNIGSRVSQVLEINGDDINILRSTIKNTRIHQPRQKYENHITDKSINELNHNLNFDDYYS
jgi:hypothetical protein